jgi:hypothetical protein
VNLSPQRSGTSGTETSIRQLIVNGKSKTALDNAKEFHKKQGSADSERLLIDAYLARIQALFDQNLAVEAKSLMALVRERFPSANERLDALSAAASARGGYLDELLKPLNDPAISAESRASIEQLIQSQVTDLAALAGCAALPPEHSLRKAAESIDKAFNVVTSGPVTDEQIELPEVSHRSPLAQWKLLIRAIASFYREQDKSCEGYLDSIRPESAPFRLVPAMRFMLGAKPAAKTAPALKPAEAALASRTSSSLEKLRGTLANLDRAFAHDDEPGHVFKAIRAAVQECRQSAPGLLGELRKKVSVRGEVGGYDMERVIAALDGAPRRDAMFCRDVARALERSGYNEDLMLACEWWEGFRLEAVREGRFNDRGLEVAALYLHMAGVLGRMPKELLWKMQRPIGQAASRETNYFRYPEELYQRAVAIDRHPDVFSQWLQWARGNSVREAENVARAWNKALPDAVEPLLFLMEQAEKRNAFPTALSHLDKAERIDAVNPTVRTARLRLLAAGALKNLQQNKPHLAAQRLAQIADLPQSQQGDRPAFLAALRFLICHVSGDKPGSGAARLEVERALGDSVAGSLLIFGCAAFAKRQAGVDLPLPKELSKQQRSGLPASMAKVIALAADFGLGKFQLPVPYFDATEAQFSRASASLNIEQIRSLGELGLATTHPRLAWEASAAGLARGGPTEAYFLLLRAQALPEGLGPRHEVLMAAAAELGRSHRDLEVVNQAVEGGRNPFSDTPLSLTAEQSRAVLAKEKKHPAFPSRFGPGPDYSEFFSDNGCMCPACCARRGEPFDPDVFEPDLFDEFEPDEEEMERSFFETAPKGIPREILPALFEVAKEAFYSGENPEELLARILLEGEGGKKKKKGKRK